MEQGLGFCPSQSSVRVVDGICTITLVTRDVRQLFDTEVPLPPKYVLLNGDVLEFLSSTIRSRRSDARVFALEVWTPKASLEGLSSYATDDIEGALREFFSEHADRERDRLRLHFRDARKMLLCGILFMLVCTFVRNYLEPEEVHSLVSSFREGLLVIGWVALWKPIEELIFNWWPIADELRDWETLEKMALSIRLY